MAIKRLPISKKRINSIGVVWLDHGILIDALLCINNVLQLYFAQQKSNRACKFDSTLSF